MNHTVESKTDNTATLEATIEYFLEHRALEGYGQRTDEWYASRGRSVGGSEVASVLNLDRFNNQETLLINKLGLSDFVANEYTAWGHIMEPITRHFAECITGHKVYECKAYNGFVDGTGYSPDGLGVVCYDNAHGTKTNEICLFEFKAPYTRAPTDSVPRHYLPQVYSGLAGLKKSDGSHLCSSALFFDCKYTPMTIRKYAAYLQDLKRGSFTSRTNKSGEPNLPKLVGAVSFKTHPNSIGSDNYGAIWNDYKFPIALLKKQAEYQTIEKNLSERRGYTINYLLLPQPKTIDDMPSVASFEEFFDKQNATYVMVFVLNDPKVIRVEHHPDWVGTVGSVVSDFVEKLGKMQDLKEQLTADGLTSDQMNERLKNELRAVASKDIIDF